MHGARRAGVVGVVVGLLGVLCAVAPFAFAAPVPPLAAGAVLELQVGGVGGVPVDAVAAVVNFTVANPVATGYVTVYPCGAARPVASNLNFVAGQAVPNLVIAKLGTAGRVCAYTYVATDLIADVSGYFPAGSGYSPIENPTRILDTRLGLPVTRLAAGAVLELPVGGVGGVPVGAVAAVMNFTVANPAATGYVTIYPCGAPRPVASNLNYLAGQAVPNLVIAKLGTAGRVCAYTYVATDLIADVSGYFPAGSGYIPIDNPVRILDTRGSAPCGLVGAVFCETFDAPAGNGSRTGDLDPVLWGVSRGSGLTNPGGGTLLNNIPYVSMSGCGTTAWVPAPQDVRICGGKMFEAVNDGGNVVNLDTYPKQPFNFANRTGKVVFDVSADSEGPHGAWPEFIITDKPVPGTHALVGANPRARNEVGFALSGCGFGGTDKTGVGLIFVSRNNVYQEYSPFDPGVTSNCVTKGSFSALNHFEVRLSTDRIEIWGTDAGGGTLKLIAAVGNLNLQFSQGLVWLNDVHYNALKARDCGGVECGTQANHTFAWDNLGFDGPKTYRDLGFDVRDANLPGDPSEHGDATVLTGYRVGTGPTTLSTASVFRTQTPTGALVVLNSLSFAATVPSISINGGPFIDTPWPPENRPSYWEAYAIPIPLDQVHDGVNTITFKSSDFSTTVANISIILVAGAPVP